MKIVPVGKNILVEEIKSFASVTKGGIYVPTGEQDKYTLYGKVLGVGKEVKEVLEGDLIFTDKRRTVQYQFGELEYWLIDEQHLVGKVFLEDHEKIT